MDFNGVTTYSNYLTANSADSPKTSKTDAQKGTDAKALETVKSSNVPEDTAVIYDPSSKETVSAKSYTPDTVTVSKMQADLEQRTNQLKSLVETMISKQGSTYANANIFTSDFWQQFSTSKTVDEAAVKQAQQDIAEDGYWGVNQTSSRILDFAKAISGGDPSKIDELEKAFEKGYNLATKDWGDKLPSLCSDTFDAVKKGFEQWRNESSQAQVSEAAKTQE